MKSFCVCHARHPFDVERTCSRRKRRKRLHLITREIQLGRDSFSVAVISLNLGDDGTD
jgi:hypothetical protein